MNCREIEARLEAVAASALSAADEERSRRHLADCESCRELVELARIGALSEGFGAESTSHEPPAELDAAFTAEVLARIGHPGGACRRAEELLAASVDAARRAASDTARLAASDAARLAASDASDTALLHRHLESCAACRTLEPILQALAADLPRLREVAPDKAFVADVLRRTLPVEVQVRRWWDALWPQLWHRPRFASEAAYVGLAALVLVFTTPGSPLAALPSAAWAAAESAPLPRVELPQIDLEPRLAEAAAALRESQSAAHAARFGAKLRAAAGETVDLVVEVRCQFGTFWQEAASLLETEARSPRPECSPEDATESASPEESK